MAHTSVKISANSSDYQSQMKSAASQMKVLSRRKCPACDIFPDVRGFGCQQQDAFTLRSHTDSVHDRRAGDDRSKAER